MHLLYVCFLACALQFFMPELNCAVESFRWGKFWKQLSYKWLTVTWNNNFQECTLIWMIKLQDQIYAKHNHKGQWRPSEWTTSHLKSLSLSGLSWISQSKSNLDNSAAGSWMFCSADFFGLYRPYAGLAAARIDTRAFRLVMIPAFQNKMFTWTINSK